METVLYSINSKKRYNLRMGTRIFNSIYGLILISFGIFLIPKESDLILHFAVILLGFLSLLYGTIGKELLLTHDYLILDSTGIKIKRSFEFASKIKLSSVTYIKFIQTGFEITYKDFVKDYDLSWLTLEEVQMFKSKLQDYCRLNKIGIE